MTVREQYDVITVGGGLGGAALAKGMAEAGARVLVIESERQFKDRVRGEAATWGWADAQKLGFYDLIRQNCGHQPAWWDTYIGPIRVEHRDLLADTGLPFLAFPHPAMQEMLLSAAAQAGAEVRRGVSVRDVKAGAPSRVVVEAHGKPEEFRGRLVVGADGRSSNVRTWAGFKVQRDQPWLQVSGVMLGNSHAPQDTFQWRINTESGEAAVIFPLGGGRVRAYFGFREGRHARFQGEGDLRRFIEKSVQSGAPAEIYADTSVLGPLATFDGADTWVDHPYRNGVALVGDAAASSDPSWGQGLSLTMRDARVLRDCLLDHEDWDAAGHIYAEEHDRYYSVTHRVGHWFGQMFFDTSAEGQALRGRSLPLIAQEPQRVPDAFFRGPEVPADETVRRRFFGEE
jgi:2-polyprenyl-6-methoxyphenol hydroxylase-like FAD-dependent oxidoreductase